MRRQPFECRGGSELAVGPDGNVVVKEEIVTKLMPLKTIPFQPCERGSSRVSMMFHEELWKAMIESAV